MKGVYITKMQAEDGEWIDPNEDFIFNNTYVKTINFNLSVHGMCLWIDPNG